MNGPYGLPGGYQPVRHSSLAAISRWSPAVAVPERPALSSDLLSVSRSHRSRLRHSARNDQLHPSMQAFHRT